MKALPFPCIRPVPEHAAAVAVAPPAVFGSAESLREHIETGALVEDRNRSLYLYEIAGRTQRRTGIVAVCPADDYASGTIRPFVQADGGADDRDDVMREAERICALGCQVGPIALTYPDQPVLDMIIETAKASTPLYALVDGQGTRHTVWEVVRTEAVEAICAMLDQLPSAAVADDEENRRASAALEAARRLRERAREAGTLSGKEPFNFVLTALFPQNAQADAQEPLVLCGGLFAHRIVAPTS